MTQCPRHCNIIHPIATQPPRRLLTSTDTERGYRIPAVPQPILPCPLPGPRFHLFPQCALSQKGNRSARGALVASQSKPVKPDLSQSRPQILVLILIHPILTPCGLTSTTSTGELLVYQPKKPSPKTPHLRSQQLGPEEQTPPATWNFKASPAVARLFERRLLGTY